MINCGRESTGRHLVQAPLPDWNVARRRHRRPAWERGVPHGRHRPQWVEKMEFAALRQRQPRYRTQSVSTAVRSKLQPRGPGVADGRGVAPDL